MTIKMTCPTCGSHDISKNGTTRCGKQNYKCQDCNRQFVEDLPWKPKDKNARAFVNLLLLENILSFSKTLENHIGATGTD